MVYYSLANPESFSGHRFLTEGNGRPAAHFLDGRVDMLQTIISALAVYVSTSIDYSRPVLMIIFSQSSTKGKMEGNRGDNTWEREC